MSAVQQAILAVGAAVSGRPTVTWNPSDKDALITLSGGNLTATRNSASDSLKAARATYGIAHTESGYFEVEYTGGSGASPYILIGIGLAAASLAQYPGYDASGWGYYQETGQKVTSAVVTAYGAAFAVGDVIGVAFKNGSVWWSKNGAWQNSGDPAANTGAAFTGITGTVYPMIGLNRGTAPADSVIGRFKTADFSYSPPSGFDPWGT